MKSKPTIAALLFAALLATSCSDVVRYALLGSREHATTEGEARVTPHDGGGFDLTVDVDRLPTNDHLGFEEAHFFVWVRPEGETSPTRAVELEVDPTTRRGRGSAVVANDSFELKITAESTADPATPSGTVLVAAVLEPAD